MIKAFFLKLENGSTLESRCDTDLIDVRPGDICVFQKDFHTDTAQVVRELKEPSNGADIMGLPEIIRVAEINDFACSRSTLCQSLKSAPAERTFFANSIQPAVYAAIVCSEALRSFLKQVIKSLKYPPKTDFFSFSICTTEVLTLYYKYKMYTAIQKNTRK